MKETLHVCLMTLLLLELLGCAATTNRIGLDDSGGVQDTMTSSQDLRTVCQRMARSIIQIPDIANAQSAPRIAFLEVKNRSNEILDTGMFLDKIRTLTRYSEYYLYAKDRALLAEELQATNRELDAAYEASGYGA